jgi:hypothetical protein
MQLQATCCLQAACALWTGGSSRGCCGHLARPPLPLTLTAAWARVLACRAAGQASRCSSKSLTI